MTENFADSFNRAKNPSENLLKKHSKKPNKDIGVNQSQALESNTEAQNFNFTPKKVENKTERLQLLIKPSTMEQLTKIAKKYEISKNELATQILDNYLERL